MKYYAATLTRPTTLNRFSDDWLGELPAGSTGTAYLMDVEGMKGLIHLNIVGPDGGLWTGHVLPGRVTLGDVVATINEGQGSER